MPRKIQNPTRSGLPAKIYMLCYLNEESGYSLGKKIYAIESGIPPTSKIYSWTKLMIKNEFLEKTTMGYKVSIQRLVKEIIKENHLSSFPVKYQKQLERVLNSDNFKEYIGGFYKRFEPHSYVDFGNKTMTYIQEFDALKLISETIGMISTLCYNKRKFHRKPFDESEEIAKQYVRSVKDSTDSNFLKNFEQDLFLFKNVEKEFLTLSDDVLVRLATMWPASHTIIFSEYVNYFNRHNKEATN